MIVGRSHGISAVRYDDEEDENGERVNIKCPIELSEGQELSIVRKNGKIKKEVVVFVENSEGDGDREGNPRDDLDEAPLSPNPAPRIPVGVS